MNTNSTWKGYTLQELRFLRIVTQTKIEIEKARILEEGNKLKKDSVSANFAPPLFKKLMGALDYADYMVLAFSLGRRVVKLLRHKKK